MPDQVDPPRTQYNRNLTIRLEGGGPTDSFTFSIKPGEFQSEHPARMSTTQTLQGVYQDFGGLGVQKLTYQGNTGWRRLAPNAPHDGFEVFQALYNETYKEYHRRMQQAADPSQIKCKVIDDLYDTTYEVSLDDFQATKSKSAPLLYNYTLHMTVINTPPSPSRDPVDYRNLPVLSNGTSVIGAAINDAIDIITGKYLTNSVQTYQVQTNDTLSSIAWQFYHDSGYASYMRIAQANAIQNPDIILVGQILIIP